MLVVIVEIRDRKAKGGGLCAPYFPQHLDPNAA